MQLHVHQNKINRLIVITWNPSQLPFQHQCCLSYTVFLVTLVLYHLGKLINFQSRATVLPFHFCTHPWYTSERTAYDAGTISLFSEMIHGTTAGFYVKDGTRLPCSPPPPPSYARIFGKGTESSGSLNRRWGIKQMRIRQLLEHYLTQAFAIF